MVRPVFTSQFSYRRETGISLEICISLKRNRLSGWGYRINSRKRTEMRTRILLLGCAGAAIFGVRAESALPLDLSGFRAGAVTLEQRPSAVQLCWPDEKNR